MTPFKKYSFAILFLVSLTCFAQKEVSNDKEEKSLVEIIKEQTEAKTITDKPLIVINDHVVPIEDLPLLNEFSSKELLSISFLSSEDAVKLYEEDGKNGVVIIETFIDSLLTNSYYQTITQPYIKESIENAIDKFEVYRFPLLVLDGVPLRGEDIASKLNNLEDVRIKSIIALKKKAAYSIYGIRAINGVLIITTLK